MVKDLSKGKNSLKPFSKELKVVLLYSIKTVVSHLNGMNKDNPTLLHLGGLYSYPFVCLHLRICPFFPNKLFILGCCVTCVLLYVQGCSFASLGQL